MQSASNRYEEFNEVFYEETCILTDHLDRVRPVTFVERFKKVIHCFGLKTLTLQEFALIFYDIKEPERLTNGQLKKAYDILYPFLRRAFIGCITDENELKRMGSNKTLYCPTQKGLDLVRLVDPLFMVFLSRYAFFREALFFVSFEEAKRELCNLLGPMTDRTAKKILPYKYKVGKNLLVLKSNPLERWQNKYPGFPLLVRQQVLDLFPKKSYAVALITQELLKEKALISADEVISYFDSKIISQKVKGLEKLTKEQNEL